MTSMARSQQMPSRVTLSTQVFRGFGRRQSCRLIHGPQYSLSSNTEAMPVPLLIGGRSSTSTGIRARRIAEKIRAALGSRNASALLAGLDRVFDRATGGLLHQAPSGDQNLQNELA
jgi:hypothetical protein